MKYFTPELVVRSQSQEDDVLDEVDRLWDEAGEQYAAYLDTIRCHFPLGLRGIDSDYYLHDAEIRSIGRAGWSYTIVLQLDTPPQSLLTYKFDLVAEPLINKEALPPELRSHGRFARWMYEEWELIAGEPPAWGLSVLLSNGWEVYLQFRDVEVEDAQAILPPPQLELAIVQ